MPIRRVRSTATHRPGPQPTAVGIHIFAGGFTAGVKQAGFNVLAHLEDGPYGVPSARANWPDLPVYIGEDNWEPFLNGLGDSGTKLGFLYANPPCAIFSTIGCCQNGGPDAWRTDPRLGCWYRALQVFSQTHPAVFALESVCQAYTRGREVIDLFTKRSLTSGYSVYHVFTDAKWTGIPQSRRRFFFIAYRPWLPLKLHFNFSHPPTVGEVLRRIKDPGYFYNDGPRANFAQWIEKTPPGGKLMHTFNKRYPKPEIGSRGQVLNRPGFNYVRLNSKTQMGAYAGNYYAHPWENRFLSIREVKALCGYPDDFKLEKEAGREPYLLLSRAVLPPVGEWLGRAVLEALTSTRKVNKPPTVHFVDLRKAPGVTTDITAQYDPTAEPPTTAVIMAGVTRKQDNRQTRPSRRVSATGKMGGSPATTGEVPQTPGGEVEKPQPGEGSGAFIRRLWMTGRYGAGQLVALVHQNWEGRTTTVADVYWNYRKLLRELGEGSVPAWRR